MQPAGYLYAAVDVAIPLVFFSVLGALLAYKLPEGDPVQHRARLRNILLLALALRIVLATLFATIPAIRFFHEDAEGYEWWGRQIARSWVSDVNADDYALNRPQNYGYPYLIAVFNLLLGESLAIGSMLNAVVGMLTVLAVYRLACDSFHPIVGLRSAKFVAFFPSMVLWSSLALKDPLITLLAVMPSSTLSAGPGGISCPWRIMKMFSPLPSETWPFSLSMIASSKPFAFASVLARALFT